MSTLWMMVALGTSMAAGGGLAGLWLRKRHRTELCELDEAMAAEVERRTRTYQRLSARVREELQHVHGHVASRVRERVDAYTELQRGVARMIGGFEDREARTRALLAAQRDRIRRLEEVVRDHVGGAATPYDGAAASAPRDPATADDERAVSGAVGSLDDLTRIQHRLEAAVGADQSEILDQTAWIERLIAALDELRPVARSLAETEEELLATKARELALTSALHDGAGAPNERERRRLESTIGQLRQSLVDLEALWNRREAELRARIDELSANEDEAQRLRAELDASRARGVAAAEQAAELESLRDEYDASLCELEGLERRLWDLEHPKGTTAQSAGRAGSASSDAGGWSDESVPTLRSLVRSLEDRPE